MDNVKSERINPEKLMNELSGIGEIPVDELPDKYTVSTPSDLESEYSIHREKILSEPRLGQALDYNESIDGFCNISESELRLEINPEFENKLYRKQYPVPAAATEAVSKTIQRWLGTGKITLAPPNCKYNSALVVALKRDAFGNFTGIRTCLDTRPLNNSLITDDKFQLPFIRNVLEQFTGCDIFDEFDLSEAYLQFQLHPDSRPYTAFTWQGVQYMFVGCPFGINLLPSHFQRIMSFIFHDCKFTIPYLDNIPIGSSDWVNTCHLF